MLLKIAWRNIWRNKTRSFVVMGAVIVGIWSILFLMGMVNGMIESYVNKAIKNEVSHIKINQPDYIKNNEVKYYIDHVSKKIELIDTMAGVKVASARTKFNAMISSSHSGRGVSVVGIDPSQEVMVSGVHEYMKEGAYLKDDDKNKIIISARTAAKLKVKIRSKIVLTFQDMEHEITMGAFRIVGIFDTGNNPYDESVVFVRSADINRILGTNDIAHEIAVLINNLDDLEIIQSKIKQIFPALLVRNYKEVQPELELFQQQIKMSGVIYMIIFMLALVFGIVNTMMMAVLERIKELGMLMAIGMNRFKVFLMIVLETLLLTLIAAPIGLVLGYLTTLYYHTHGLNLFFYSKQAMSQFGFDNTIYTSVPKEIYLQIVVAITITALIGSLYPAWKAIRLRPVDAIRGSLKVNSKFSPRRILRLKGKQVNN